jgi:hypothetical protein
MGITSVYGNSSSPISTFQIREVFSTNSSDSNLLNGVPVEKLDFFVQRLYSRITNANISKADKSLLMTTLGGAVLGASDSDTKVKVVQLFEQLIGLKESQYVANIKQENETEPKEEKEETENTKNTEKTIKENSKSLGFDEETQNNISKFLSNKKDEYIPSSWLVSPGMENNKVSYEE